MCLADSLLKVNSIEMEGSLLFSNFLKLGPS